MTDMTTAIDAIEGFVEGTDFGGFKNNAYKNNAYGVEQIDYVKTNDPIGF